MQLKNLYNQKYYKDAEWYSRYGGRLRKIINIILPYKPKKVLDVGCGQGYLVRALRDRKIEAVGIDFSDDAGEYIPDYFIQAEAQNLPFPDNSFDMVISTDFFEHLKEEDIDKVYSEMKRVGKDVLAMISFEVDEPYHLVVKPRDWWQEKLENCHLIVL